MDEARSGKKPKFSISEDGALRFGSRLCMPNDPLIKNEILEEAHYSPHTIHSSGTKTYHNLHENSWWNNTKREIAHFVEHAWLVSKLRCCTNDPWICWEKIKMDSVLGLLRSPKGHDAIWVIVVRMKKSVHFLSIQMNCSLDQLAQLYVNEIVRLHDAPFHFG